jgi:hypothetical protein
MGMIYKGVEYHYAFEFNVTHEYSSHRVFNIVISNYREKFQDFTGLCLDNEIKVISIQPMIFAAFFDIVSQIIDITTQSEKAYTERYPGKTWDPLMTVTNPDFLADFEECKKNSKSLNYYEKLKRYIEGEASISESDQKKITMFDVVDAQPISFFYEKIRTEALPVTNANFFRIGKGLQLYG